MGELIASDFEVFWKQYPRRVGKIAAQKAYSKARTQASASEILNGVERYKKGKPGYADWAHPSTWLNQGRWMDEPDTVPAVKVLERPFTATELRQASEWYRLVGTSLDRDVPRQEHIARFIRKQRLQVAS